MAGEWPLAGAQNRVAHAGSGNFDGSTTPHRRLIVVLAPSFLFINCGITGLAPALEKEDFGLQWERLTWPGRLATCQRNRATTDAPDREHATNPIHGGDWESPSRSIAPLTVPPTIWLQVRAQ
jgi:hypothetical protein